MYNFEHQATKKRTLKKVRKQFIYKPEDIRKTVFFDYTHHYLSNQPIAFLNRFMGLVEVNREIYVSTEHLNRTLTIKNAEKKENPYSKVVVLGVELKQQSDHYILSSEYIAKRLESYGDLELATFAYKLKRFYQNRNQFVESYYKFISSKASQNRAYIKKIKDLAASTCQELESKYPYKKNVLFVSESPAKLESITYSSDFLNIIGFDSDEFVLWTKSNGLPESHIQKCQAYLERAMKGLQCNPLINSIDEGKDHLVRFKNKKGKECQYIGQYIDIVDPTPDGFFIYTYFILKEKPSVLSIQNEEYSDIGTGFKYIKEEKKEEDISLTGTTMVMEKSC